MTVSLFDALTDLRTIQVGLVVTPKTVLSDMCAAAEMCKEGLVLCGEEGAVANAAVKRLRVNTCLGYVLGKARLS